jgi:acyl-CoA thioesterase-2
MRVPRALDDDPALHQRLLAYMSDLTLLDNAVLPHGRNGRLGSVMVASIGHSLWFHRVTRADAWMLYVQDSPAAAGARGFARGTLYASVAQDGLLRRCRASGYCDCQVIHRAGRGSQNLTRE